MSPYSNWPGSLLNHFVTRIMVFFCFFVTRVMVFFCFFGQGSGGSDFCCGYPACSSTALEASHSLGGAWGKGKNLLEGADLGFGSLSLCSLVHPSIMGHAASTSQGENW